MKLFNHIDDILDSPITVPVQTIGHSRENRPIQATVLGHGKINISLIGGCHADEPVGPRFLRKLTGFLASLEEHHPLLKNYRWWLLPHANPDGEAINMKWYCDEDMVFDILPYLRYVVRELPGNDVEFSFPTGKGEPGQRPETEVIYRWWTAQETRFHLHASLHGMMVAAGPWFLMEKQWIQRSQRMQELCREEVFNMNYRLHDVDRKGEKGFHRISPGFCTRPDSRSMHAFFRERNDHGMAEKFFPSSMEAIRDIGGDPLTIVSEMPLFILPDLPQTMDWPNKEWDQWMSRLQEWKARLLTNTDEDHTIRQEIREAGIIPMPVDDQMRLQWRFITAAVEQLH